MNEQMQQLEDQGIYPKGGLMVLVREAASKQIPMLELFPLEAEEAKEKGIPPSLA
jgi:hypothetical protein